MIAVSNRIRCRNRQRMPRQAEKNYPLRYCQERREVMFSLVTDVKGAHGLINIREDERGMLTCEFDGGDLLQRGRRLRDLQRLGAVDAAVRRGAEGDLLLTGTGLAGGAAHMRG